MNTEDYGKVISSILTKLGLGLPLTKEESQILYEFIMSQNGFIGETVQAISKYERQVQAYKRQATRLKGKVGR